MTKKEQFDNLIIEMSKCQQCISLASKTGTDRSLINIYQDLSFAKSIPSIWTDWYNRLDSEIMVIGQDWGPYEEMKYFHNKFINSPLDNWKEIIEEEKSMTKKQLTKFIIESAKNNGIIINNSYIDKIYITNAIMCARKGINYRGDNIDLKTSTINCKSFLKEQIEIVKPKIIITLGLYPLMSLSNIYKFKIHDSLTKNIEELGEIVLDDVIIIPMYHPVAQIKKEKQLCQYNKIWSFVLKK